MHSSTVIRRTPAGDAELAARAHNLSLAQRRFLTLLDTPANLEQLARRHLLDVDKLERDVAQLADAGLVVRNETPVASERPEPPATTVRLGSPSLARRAPLALLTVAGGALVWVAWQHLAPPATNDAGDSHVVAPLPPHATAKPQPASATAEPSAIATRVLRSDVPANAHDAAKDAHAVAKPNARGVDAPRMATATPSGSGAAAGTHGEAPRETQSGPTALAMGSSGIAIPARASATPAAPPAPPGPVGHASDSAAPAAAIAAGPKPSGATPPPGTSPLPETVAPGMHATASAAAAPSSSPAAATAAATTGPGDAIHPADAAPLRVASAAPTGELARAAPPARLVPIAREAPEFPREALAQGVETGNVKARLTVGADGKVTSVDILAATPHRVFDRAVRSALSRWQFEPGPGGRTTTVDVAFKRD